MIHILTTSYNCEQYIERCLASITSQKNKNFKCYVTDDMSTDNSVIKIKNFIKGDDRFVLIENSVKKYCRDIKFRKFPSTGHVYNL